MASHPDPERLAAYQAGDGDRRERGEVEAHLAGCSACAEVVASVERARSRLALLEEPRLPPGLHDRLAAAVAGEAAEEPLPRRAPWYRRPAAWGAAAALLLAALVVPLLDRSSERMTASDAGGGAATELAQGPPAPVAGLPVIRVPGEVSAAAVRSRLATDPRAIRALASAGGARSSAGGSATADSPTPEAAPKDQGGTDRSGTGQGGTGQGGTGEPGTGTGQGGTGEPGTGTGEPGAGQAGDTPPSTPASPAANLQSCLPAATAAADPASIPLTPAFFVEGTYQGRPATILVTTSTTQPGRVDLWVFPRADCTAAPLATERVR